MISASRRIGAILVALAISHALPDPTLAAPVVGTDQEALGGPDIEDDDFYTGDLLGRVSKLRPVLRLSQDFVARQEHDDTEVDTYTTSLRASLGAPITKRLAMRVEARLDVTQSNFDGDPRFLDTGRSSGDPFDELFDNRFRLEGRYRLTDSWTLLAGGAVGANWERGADYRDSLRGSGAFAVGYAWGKRVSVIAGVRVASRVASPGVRVRPLFKIAWQVTDDLEIETRNLGLRVSYRIQRGLKVYTASQWRSRSYRLDDRGGTVGKGFIRNRTVPAIAGVSWRISKHWRLRAHAGAIAYQRYTARDNDRKVIDRSTSDGPAFTGQLQVRFRF